MVAVVGGVLVDLGGALGGVAGAAHDFGLGGAELGGEGESGVA